MWESLSRRGIEEGMIKMIQALYKNSTNKVRAHNNESIEFITKIGLKQGCVSVHYCYQQCQMMLLEDVKENARVCSQGFGL